MDYRRRKQLCLSLAQTVVPIFGKNCVDVATFLTKNQMFIKQVCWSQFILHSKTKNPSSLKARVWIFMDFFGFICWNLYGSFWFYFNRLNFFFYFFKSFWICLNRLNLFESIERIWINWIYLKSNEFWKNECYGNLLNLNLKEES